MLRQLVGGITIMLSNMRTDFSHWFSSLRTFSDWYRLIMYRASYVFKKDSSIIFTLHARKGTRLRARIEDFSSIFGCWLSREYFPKERYTLPDEAKIVDIGASIGLFTLFVATEYPGSRIFSYEPGTRSFELLLENIRMNHLEKRVKAINVAVSSTKGEDILYVPTYETLGSLFAEKGSPMAIKTLTLDDIVAEVGKIDFLKIDTEGAEYEILPNVKKDTLRKIMTISLEYHDDVTEHKHSEILRLLRKNGYRTKVLLEHENKITGIIFASKQDVERG